MKRLGEYCKGKTETLDNVGLVVLLAVVSAQYPEPLYACEIKDSVEEIVKEINHPCSCPCVFDEIYTEEETERTLEHLAENGLLQEVDGRFVVLPEYRKGQFEEALYQEFSGLGYIARKDLVSAAALLSLSDGAGKIEDILERVKNYGLEIDYENITCRLKDLAEEGIVKESYGWLDVNPAYWIKDNPDQLSFDFSAGK